RPRRRGSRRLRGRDHAVAQRGRLRGRWRWRGGIRRGGGGARGGGGGGGAGGGGGRGGGGGGGRGGGGRAGGGRGGGGGGRGGGGRRGGGRPGWGRRSRWRPPLIEPTWPRPCRDHLVTSVNEKRPGKGDCPPPGRIDFESSSVG